MKLKIALVAAAFSLVASTAYASIIDLTPGGVSGTLVGQTGGTALVQPGGTLSGTGVFPSFVEITGNDAIHDAYNTTANNVLDNGSSDTFNHSIRVSDLTTVNGGQYYQFLLDINEKDNAEDRYVSLDKLTIITSTTANQSVQGLPSGTTRWNMSASDSVVLDYDLFAGSGKYDMKLLIPVSAFSGALSTDFVYLYSQFGALGVVAGPCSTHGTNDSTVSTCLPGGNYGASDGFEEWALNATSDQTFCQANPTAPECNLAESPEPATLALFGTGLAIAAISLRRRTAKQ